MSYDFTCNDATGNDDYEQPNYQPLPFFHTVSYDQGVDFINTLSCFSTTNTGNAIPVVTQLTAPATIPKSTPFALTGTATDANAGMC